MNRNSLLGLAAAAAIAASAPAFAAPIVAGDPNLTPYTLQYGDFNVVSLALANYGSGTNDYYVKSAPGALRDNIVIGTHAGGNFGNGNISGAMDLAGSDNPYSTPTGAGAPSYFRTGNTLSSLDPGGAGEFSGDGANSWDISLATMRTYLAGDDAVFYFNLNETGTTDILSGTDLLFYMKVSLLNSSTGAQQDFYLAGNPFDPSGSHNGADLAAANGGPDETLAYPDIASGSNYDPQDPRWTYVHGDICVLGSTFIHYGSCTGGDAGAQTVKQNLGADQAAFAAYNLVLSDLINNVNSGFDTLRIDWRMADLNNGYEQLFILRSGAPDIDIPEPLTIGLVGAGLIGVGLLRRRRKKA